MYNQNSKLILFELKHLLHLFRNTDIQSAPVQSIIAFYCALP